MNLLQNKYKKNNILKIKPTQLYWFAWSIKHFKTDSLYIIRLHMSIKVEFEKLFSIPSITLCWKISFKNYLSKEFIFFIFFLWWSGLNSKFYIYYVLFITTELSLRWICQNHYGVSNNNVFWETILAIYRDKKAHIFNDRLNILY